MRAKFRDHRTMFAPVARIETSNTVFNETLRRSGLRSCHAGDRDGGGALSLCGDPLVQHGVRPRRDHHRHAAPGSPPMSRWSAALLAVMQAREVDPVRMPNRARSCTRRAAARWRLRRGAFGRYYGSVNSTPLFVMLAGAYFERTGDMGPIEGTVANIEAALTWIDTMATATATASSSMGGEPRRSCQPGLEGQLRQRLPCRRRHGGGADSPGRGPGVCLCRQEGGGRSCTPARFCRPRRPCWSPGGRTCVVKFENTFWLEERHLRAGAGRDKRQCRVRTSNAGHGLFGGVASPEHAARVAAN